MFRIVTKWCLGILALVFFTGAMIEISSTTAEARFGGGRSSGRSSGFGSRRYSSPPSQGNSQQYNKPNSAQPAGAPAPASGGGFLRNMAGGMAGGLLGSMLFSSLGQAGGFGGGSGGPGILPIILIAGLAYFGFRWWKSRSQSGSYGNSYTGGNSNQNHYATTHATPDTQPMNQYRALPPEGIDAETASDIFFRVQGAWTRRDLTSVKNVLDVDIQSVLQQDLAELKQKQHINRLENITVRGATLLNTWQEENTDYSSVRFTANLLDYTTDEKSGQVVAGSDSLPVKFEEDWTFAKGPGAVTWQLAGIQQV